MLADRTAQIRTADNLLYGMAETLQDEVAAGKMTLEQAKEEFRRRGRKMTFNDGQGYPNVYNTDKSMLLNSANPQIEGKITGAKDANGVSLVDIQMNAARESLRAAPLRPLPAPRRESAGPENGLCPQLRALAHRDELRALCR